MSELPRRREFATVAARLGPDAPAALAVGIVRRAMPLARARSAPFVRPARPVGKARAGAAFWRAKRGVDLLLCVAVLPVFAALVLVLAVLNPVWNPGPLFFRQRRMGRDCRPFVLVKFRTMRPAEAMPRGPCDPLETERITPLGEWLRRTRLDEVAQVWNVAAGEMSWIGPRPDCHEHALAYLRAVPRYRERHAVRPGVSGLAQVTLGYTEGPAMAALKVRKDVAYIRRAGWRLEALVVARTVRVMASGFGAR